MFVISKGKALGAPIFCVSLVSHFLGKRSHELQIGTKNELEITFQGFVVGNPEHCSVIRQSEGSGGENAGMWGSDITGRYITPSQVHCQAGPGLRATHICIVLSPTRMSRMYLDSGLCADKQILSD